MFGSMIDASCNLWEEDCGVRGSCWVYDNLDMSRRFFILTIICKILSIGFNILGVIIYKPPAVKEKDPDSAMEALAEQNENHSNNIDSSSTISIIAAKGQE